MAANRHAPSAGAGSPGWFACPRERRERYFARAMGGPIDEHEPTLTGRTRPYRPKRGSALGVRSTLTSREYTCTCGYVGWSNHSDLERLAKA